MPNKYRERTTWSKCTRFRFPPFVVTTLDRFQRKWNGGDKTLDIYHQNLTNILVRQPAEIILLIADFLSPASRVLLSLSSKRLRVILTQHLDLSLTDGDLRVEFLLLLERDLPDYLTCHCCASMFRWQRQKHKSYMCTVPRSYGRKRSKRAITHPYPNVSCSCPRMTIGSELFDLVIRAHHRGPNHGLPPSIIDHECNGLHGLPRAQAYHRRFEGRMVNGHFFLARLYILILDIPDLRNFLFNTDDLWTCLHSVNALYAKITENVRNWDRQRDLDVPTMKCRSCATDFKAKLSSGSNRLVRVEINIWQDYGGQLPRERRRIPVFRDNIAKLDSTGPALRDLERDYNASREAERTN